MAVRQALNMTASLVIADPLSLGRRSRYLYKKLTMHAYGFERCHNMPILFKGLLMCRLEQTGGSYQPVVMFRSILPHCSPARVLVLQRLQR
jgi:hypothetical protein